MVATGRSAGETTLTARSCLPSNSVSGSSLSFVRRSPTHLWKKWASAHTKPIDPRGRRLVSSPGSSLL